MFSSRQPTPFDPARPPGALKEHAETGHNPPRPAKVPPKRILVVDDNTDVAETLAVLLRLWGHQVSVAANGMAALEMARLHRPQIVFLDIDLPEMDGYQVARRLREQAGAEAPLLFALTGYGQEEDRRGSREAGLCAHLVKPVDPEELEACLARAEWLPSAGASVEQAPKTREAASADGRPAAETAA